MQQTVIIADDAPFIRAMLKDILEDMDWTVTAEACDGREAVDEYVRLRPDVVMLDITMPDTDGLTACREILAHDPDARVVMISALGQRDEVLDAIRCGAADFVIKPFEADRVELTLRRIVTRSPQPV